VAWSKADSRVSLLSLEVDGKVGGFHWSRHHFIGDHVALNISGQSYIEEWNLAPIRALIPRRKIAG
jgi:hypothetical protein